MQVNGTQFLRLQHQAMIAMLGVCYAILCYGLLSHSAYAHEHHQASTSTSPNTQHSALHLAFDASGTLWRVRVYQGLVLVDSSQDLAKSFSAALKLNVMPQNIQAKNEDRPQIAIGPEGHIYVVWTEVKKSPSAGFIWFARSMNHGKSFEKPYLLHEDSTDVSRDHAHLNVSLQGVINVAWFDKRQLNQGGVEKLNNKLDANDGKSDHGAAIFYSTSANQGKSFSAGKSLATAACDCCRLASSNRADGTVSLMWRAIFANQERDHMIAEVPKSNEKPQLHRASFGHWKIDGCPHHGAAMTHGGEGSQWWGYHMAYYDGQEKKPGLYYARMDGEAWASSVPNRVGNSQFQAGHPALLSTGEKVWLVWREINKNTYSIYGQFSIDDGKNWSAAKLLVEANEKIDYPQLLRDREAHYLAVHQFKKGLELIILSMDSLN